MELMVTHENRKICHSMHNTVNPLVCALRISCKNTYNSKSVTYLVLKAVYISDEREALYPLRGDTHTFLIATTVKVYKH